MSELRLIAALTMFTVGGLSGSTFGVYFAYCADIVAQGRNKSMNGTVAFLLGVSFTPATILAAPICDFIQHHFGVVVMWRVMFLISAVNLMYATVLLPESIVQHDGAGANSPTSASGSPTAVGRRPSTDISLNPFRYFRLLFRHGPVGNVGASMLRRVGSCLFLLYFAKCTLLSVITLYAEELLNWSAPKAAYLMTVWGISQFTSFQALSFFSRCACSGYDRAVAWVGLFFCLAGMALMISGGDGYHVFPAMGVGAVSMITLTALTSYAGKLCDQTMAGEVQGLLSCTVELSELVGPPLFGWILKWGIKNVHRSPWLPNLPFAIGAGSVLMSMAALFALPSSELAKSRMSEEKRPIETPVLQG